MTEEQGLSVMDLLKPQIPLTSLGMEVVGKKSSRDLPVQEDVAPHFMLKKNTKDTFSYFGIDLDKENAFLETIPLRNAILSLNCINKNFTSASSSTSPSKELKQRHVLARLPVENPEKLINHIIQNDNIKIPKKVLTKMVLSLSPSKGLILPSVHEAKTPEKFYNGNDILDCHSSPWPHLDEDQYHSLRPDRSPKKCSGNGMYNKMQSPKPSFVVNQQNQEKLLECKHQDADVSSLITQNQNRSDGIKSASKDKTLNILQHIDDEEPSQNEVPSFSVVFPSGSADSVVVSADDGTMGNIASSTETKDCSSNTLLQQGHAAVTDLNKNLKHNCSSINLNGNVSSKQTLNVGKIPREGSVTDSVHMKTNDSTVNDVTQEMTDEEDLNQSMCNMSVQEKFNLTNDSNKTDIFIVLDETVDDDSNNSTNEITKKKHDDSLDNNSKIIFLYNKEEVPCFSKSQSGSVEGLVKPYLQPFVSKDPQENKDNEDPKWSYMAKLATDEERYQHTRKLWKSIVVPDPNVNNTYSGYSRRWGIQRNYSEDTSSTTRVKVSKKRKHELEEDNPEQPPKKRARGILDIRFSVQRFNESMSLVTLSYMEEQNLQHRSSFQSLKLEKTYNEKIHQLIMARVEVEALQKFYAGLPDQELSVSQTSVEAEQWEIEQLYTKFKHVYGWSGRVFLS